MNPQSITQLILTTLFTIIPLLTSGFLLGLGTMAIIQNLRRRKSSTDH